VGTRKAKIFAVVLAASLAAGAPARAEDAAPAHAPCTSLDLWGDLKAVIDGCEALIKSGKLTDEDLAEALRHQGDAYFRSFMVRFAFNNYQHALQLKPDWPRALWNLSNAYAVLGYSDLAIKSARRAAEVDPTYSNAHAALGAFLSDTDESLKEFDRALELDPKNYLARSISRSPMRISGAIWTRCTSSIRCSGRTRRRSTAPIASSDTSRTRILSPRSCASARQS